MSIDFIENLEGLTPEQKLHFYEVLAHNLTVIIRDVCIDSDISDAEKVEQIKWINEVAHRVTAKIYVLRLNTHKWTEADSWQLFDWAVKQSSSIRTHLSGAIEQSYSSVANDV
jgi:hypothetical protein